jgi:coenzyme F420-0:L-glutamate ligase/coenzyme F420-1:gamma-L-glutamate ligase
MHNALSVTALADIGEIRAGADLAAELAESLRRAGLTLQRFDVLVVAQKIVSKSEGRFVRLSDIEPSAQARELAAITGKDARLVELVLRESSDVVRAAPQVLITRHRLGLVMANAGVDRSNVPGHVEDERVLLLPENPDASAARLREQLLQRAELETELGVIVSDSFGRPWRRGVTNVAIGAAGIPALIDRRGEPDREGRKLEVTEVAYADAIAAAAGLAMGEGAEGRPAVLVRGLRWNTTSLPAAHLLRPSHEDLFR